MHIKGCKSQNLKKYQYLNPKPQHSPDFMQTSIQRHVNTFKQKTNNLFEFDSVTRILTDGRTMCMVFGKPVFCTSHLR